MELVAAGRTNIQIGAQLHISPYTVKAILVKIATKIGTGNRAEMVAVLFRAGVLH